MPNGRKAWFLVKRYGYGAGLPISWEGWACLLLYGGVVIISGMILPTLLFIVVAVIATAIFIYTARNHSDDEWRWRNGD